VGTRATSEYERDQASADRERPSGRESSEQGA
jgi:hypothetical protein